MAAAASAATAGVYHYIAYPAAGLFWDVSQPGPALACLVVSAAGVAGLGLWGRSRLVLDPERVYQVAMRKLTHHAGLQEVMGAPLAGSPMRVQLVTRGSLFMAESLVPCVRAPRITMLFPLTGPLQSGVVSLQAKRTPSGKYAFKRLVVELPEKRLAGAAGMQAAAAAAAAAAQPLQPGGSAGPSGSSSSGSSSTTAPPPTGTTDSSSNNSSSVDAARIFIVGSAKPSPGSSSSSSASPLAGSGLEANQEPRLPSAAALLEQLQQPLVFALQQNVVVYETEDELESELGYDTVLDQEQRTLLDLVKQGACVAVRVSRKAACKGLQQLRKAARAVAEHTRRAMKSKASSTSAGRGGAGGAAAGSDKVATLQAKPPIAGKTP